MSTAPLITHHLYGTRGRAGPRGCGGEVARERCAMLSKANAWRLPMGAPNDVSALARLLDDGRLRAADIVGIIAQTEGDAYARGFALQSFLLLLSRHLDLPMEAVQER